MNESPLLQRWYALYVRSRHEKSVSAQLETKDYEVFLPLYRVRHQWADRWKTVSLPLFPGYVFCHFDAATRSSVLGTSGVIDVIRIGGEPAPVETSEIEAIRLVVNSPLSVEPHASLARGQRVTVRGGPLKGLAGTLLDFRKTIHLAISVELLCRSVVVEIERDWVAPYEPAGLSTQDRHVAGVNIVERMHPR